MKNLTHLFTKSIIALLFIFTASVLLAQPSVTDQRTGCKLRMIVVGDPYPRVAWDGACAAGFASGYGTAVFTPGIRYTGEMRDGWRNGKGKITFPSNDSYEGEFLNSRFHGQGAYLQANGVRFEGQFREGELNGACTVTLASRERIRGNCKDSSPEGQGSIDMPDGSRYEGGLAGGQRHGQGMWKTASGLPQFAGEFKDGALWSGKAYVADGSYQPFENGKPFGSMVLSAEKQALTVLSALASAVQSQSARTGSEPGSGTGASANANVSAGTGSKVSFLHPQTGQQCVTLDNGPQDAGDKYRAIYFKNICDRSFSVRVQWPAGTPSGTGISRGSVGSPGKMRLLCQISKGECGQFTYKYD